MTHKRAVPRSGASALGRQKLYHFKGQQMFKYVCLNRGAKYYYPGVTIKVSTALMAYLRRFILTARQHQFLISKAYYYIRRHYPT